MSVKVGANLTDTAKHGYVNVVMCTSYQTPSASSSANV